MKNCITILLLFFFFNSGFPQNSGYEYSGRRTPSANREKLSKAQSIGEILPAFSNSFSLPPTDFYRLNQLLTIVDSLQGGSSFYPRENYDEVIDFVSEEIILTCNGKAVTTQSTSGALTSEQKKMLVTADLGSDIKIKFRFKYKNWASDKKDMGSSIKEGTCIVTVIPETEAEFPGGFKQLTAYFRKNVFDKIPQKGDYDKIEQAIVKFSVDEEGEVVDATISRTSSDLKTDNLLLEAITKMPRWKPAKNSRGVKVRQEFTIPFGGGC